MASIDDKILIRMAEAEILQEAKRAAERHAVIGMSGWNRCPRPNKFFLTNILLQTMASNRHPKKNKKYKYSNSKCKKIGKERKRSVKRSKEECILKNFSQTATKIVKNKKTKDGDTKKVLLQNKNSEFSAVDSRKLMTKKN